jgi:hypothetical protein
VDWLKRLLSWGRLTGEPKEHTAGKVLAPASVQRTQLGLKEVNLSRGVVKMRTGEVRAFLRVTGYTAHHRSAEECRAWLQGYARALNTLPGNAVFIVRSRPGGLDQHIATQRAQTAALAEASPGSALARLAADQLTHARQLQASGQVRQTDSYVVLHSPKGNVDRLLAAAEACRRHLAAAGVRAALVTDKRLGEALAATWSSAPNDWEVAVQQFEFPARSGRAVATLNYAPGKARVEDVLPDLELDDEPPHPKARVRPVVGSLGTNGNGKALPR